MKRELQDKEYNDQYDQITDEELIEILTERYSLAENPNCRICGEKLSVEACGSGSYIVYACSPYEEGADGKLKFKEGRKFVDDHYSRSRVESYKSSDRSVLELIERFKNNEKRK